MSSEMFSALNAKISSIYSKLPKTSDFSEMIDLESIDEMISYVSSFEYYSDILYDARSIIEIEEKLRLKNELTMNKLDKFVPPKFKDFSYLLNENFRHEKIKRVLRMLDGKTFKKEKGVLFDKYQYDENMNMEEFIDGLKDTKYYLPLKPYASGVDKNRLFYMEMSLDKKYYQDLLLYKSKFSGIDYEVLNELEGKRIDMINLLWIYRGKFFYSLLPEEIFNFSISGGSKINRIKLKKLAYYDQNSFFNEVNDSEYAFLFGENSSIPIDLRIRRHIYGLALKEWKNNAGIGKYLSFSIILDTIYRDLITIFEGIRFHTNENLIINYLIQGIGDKND